MVKGGREALLWVLLAAAAGVGGQQPQGVLLPRVVSLASSNSTNSSTGGGGGGAVEGAGGCLVLEGYRTVTVREVFWSVSHSLEVIGKRRGQDVGERLGYVSSKLFTMKTQQEWRGKDGTLMAASHKDLISLVATVHILDCRMLPLANVLEQLQQSLVSSLMLYTIQDPHKHDTIATSREAELLGKSYVRVSDGTTGKQVMGVYKGSQHMFDEWTAEFDQDAVGLAADMRVAVLMLAAGSQDLAFGMGPMPFIMFLLFMLATCICCCCANRDRVLQWAAGGADRYEEIRNPNII